MVIQVLAPHKGADISLRMDGKESKETELFPKIPPASPRQLFEQKTHKSQLCIHHLWSLGQVVPPLGVSTPSSVGRPQRTPSPLRAVGRLNEILREKHLPGQVATQKVLIPFPLTGLRRKSYLLCSQMILALGSVPQRNRTHRMHMGLLVWQSEDQQSQEPGRAGVSL